MRLLRVMVSCALFPLSSPLSLVPGQWLQPKGAFQRQGCTRTHSLLARPRGRHGLRSSTPCYFSTHSNEVEALVEELTRECSSNNQTGVFYNKVASINRDLSVLMVTILVRQRMEKMLEAMKGDGSTGNDIRGWRELAMDRADTDGLVILDAMSASGVRALRYLTEVPGVKKVVANDHDVAAVAMTRRSAELCGTGNKLEVRHGDALDAMYKVRTGSGGREDAFDVIDIDPYGSAAGFLDAAVQAVKDGGLLCVTSTDMPVLSGCQPNVAYARYGSVPVRGGYHHEMSMRILLHAISTSAARYRRSMAPVLSVALDHYVRVFVRIVDSPSQALQAGTKAMYVFQSEWCPSFFLTPIVPGRGSFPPSAATLEQEQQQQQQTQVIPSSRTSLGETPPSPHPNGYGMGGRRCPQTGGPLRMGGPIWGWPMHDTEWVSLALEMAVDAATSAGTAPRVEEGSRAQSLPSNKIGSAMHRPQPVSGPRLISLLEAVSRELPEVPLFYHLKGVFAALGLTRSPRQAQVETALRRLGYKVSGMHREPRAIKTDAPDSVMWDVLRCWVRENPQPVPRSVGGIAILSHEPQIHADFRDETGEPSHTGGRVANRRVHGRTHKGVGGLFLHLKKPERDWGPLPIRGVQQRPPGDGG